jgi:hypothetical protein
MPTLTTLALLNPGAETSPDTDWTKSTGSIQPLTSAGGVQPPRTGSYMMWAGNYDAANGNSFYQDFDVTAFASYIDAASCTVVGLSAWHQTIATQGDNGDLMLLFYDGAGALLADDYVVGPTGQLGTGWNQRVMGVTAVPANTRKIRIGARNYIGVGPSIQSFWDDFDSPTLETTLSIGTTIDLTIGFDGAGALTIAAPTDGAAGAPVVIHNLSLALSGALRLGLAVEKFPLFGCTPPPVKTWTRNAPPAAAWERHSPEPPLDCDGGEPGANDDLILTGAERLATLAGDGLKLVS